MSSTVEGITPDQNQPSIKGRDFISKNHNNLTQEVTPPSEEATPEPPSSIGNNKDHKSTVMPHIRPSISLDATDMTEEKPSIYLFILVNPLSGDKKGADLVNLPMQHFRLRRFPQVQVEIHNILDDEDRARAVKNIQLIEYAAASGEFSPNQKKPDVPINPSSSPPSTTSLSEQAGTLSDAVQNRHIHVWSAGGDGTVMSVFELLVAHKINLDLVYFSCIPFGTGNDFSQVLGWGRTIPEKNILGSKLHNLEQLIADRLEKSEAARLDIWQMQMTSYDGGYVRQAGPKERKDGHDVAEVKEPHTPNHDTELVRKMSNYVSIGVQGYVGSGFEAHRAGNRLMNMFVYAHESSKWVFWRRFPDLNQFIKNITQDDKVVLECPLSNDDSKNDHKDVPEMTTEPIDLVIQNIPHIWGREVDLWGEAKAGLESVRNRSGPTDPDTWKPQRANDSRVEIMTIENMKSYLKKLANFRDHVSRLGQFDSPFQINFREPSAHQKELDKLKNVSSPWKKTKAAVKDALRHKYEKKNVICIMCDGEFYEIKDPKSISFTRYAQIWTLGRDDDEVQGRIVTDELESRADSE